MNSLGTGDLKGVGKAKEVNASIVFTGTNLAAYYGGGKGSTVSNGILFTSKDMIAINSSGYGNPELETNKNLEVWRFSTVSKNLDWLNDTVAIVTQEGDPAWKEFKVRINEWVPNDSIT